MIIYLGAWGEVISSRDGDLTIEMGHIGFFIIASAFLTMLVKDAKGRTDVIAACIQFSPHPL